MPDAAQQTDQASYLFVVVLQFALMFYDQLTIGSAVLIPVCMLTIAWIDGHVYYEGTCDEWGHVSIVTVTERSPDTTGQL